MADREKRDISKDDNVAFELNIRNVELTNRILGTGSFASVIEASWYGTPCVAKQVYSKVLESSHSEGKRFFLVCIVCVLYVITNKTVSCLVICILI